MKEISMIATGDAFVTRRIPENGYEGFEQIQEVIRSMMSVFPIWR